jgi:hypothetical protein
VFLFSETSRQLRFDVHCGSFPGLNGRDMKFTTASSTAVEKEWRFTSTPTIRLHGVVRYNFNFYHDLGQLLVIVLQPGAELP